MSKSVKLTTRGRYAMMAMVSLAKSDQGKPVPLSQIARDGHISISYLEQLIAALRRHKLVKSYRGPGGGYILGRTISNISVSDILMAAEDSTPAKRIARNKEIKADHCPKTHALWNHIGKILYLSFKDVSLQDVLHGRFEDGADSKTFEIIS